MISIKFKLTFQDYLKFFLKRYISNYKSHFLIFTFSFILSSAIVFPKILERRYASSSLVIPIFSFLLSAGILVFFMNIFFHLLVLVIYLVKLFWSIQIKKEPLLLSEKTYKFMDKKFEASILSSKTQTGWEMIRKYQEQKDYFVLYLSDRVCHLVPKKAFRNDQQIEKLRNILKENIKS
ncbi:hypothetical protein GF362_04365 [Candidatus Dojkabacteria bacterium]|nr:hypothetical protein [Candidatus Dojkabacteria bacterium]